MATAPTTTEAAPARVVVIRERKIVLRRVPWAVYEALRDEPGNDHLRMDYLDGNLTIMSPSSAHEDDLDVLRLVVRAASAGMGLALKSTGQATLRKGTGRVKGSGKEPDQGFYIGDHVRSMKRARTSGIVNLDLNVHRPPDLAIEVDNRNTSKKALPIYAHLGVPEVWMLRVKTNTIRFLRLVGGSYVEIERSVILPKLTPALVIQAMDLIDVGEMDENAFQERVKQWAIDLPDPA